jgi:integral membrane sensor domain MASE1
LRLVQEEPDPAMTRNHSARLPALKLWPYAGILLFGTAAYWLLGYLGARIADVREPYVGPLWLSAGVGLALLLVFGYRYWPAIAIGATVVGLQVGLPAPAVAAVAAADVFGTVLAVYLLRNYVGFDLGLERLRDAIALILIGAVLCRALASAVAVAALWYGGMIPQGEFGAVWLNRWVAGVAGVLVVTPFLLALGSPRRLPRRFTGYPHAAALAAALGVVTAAAFTSLVFPPSGLHYPLAFAPLPLLMWAALRFEVPGAAAATLLVAAISLVGTLSGAGPFADLGRQEGLTLLALYSSVAAATGLVLGSAAAELRREHGLPSA